MDYDSFEKIFFEDKTFSHHLFTVNRNLEEEYLCELSFCTDGLDNFTPGTCLMASSASATEGDVPEQGTSVNEPVDNG